MREFYKAPIIKMEELEKLDALCLSTTGVKENSQSLYSEIQGKGYLFQEPFDS